MDGTTQSKPDTPLRLLVLGERLAVCRLDPPATPPPWATASQFYSVTRTPDELSVVCPEHAVPDGVTREGGWRAFKLDGTFDFEQVGVLASVAVPLAQASVSIFAVSTFDTDYVLVKGSQLETAIAALSEHGHEVRIGEPVAHGAVTIRRATAEDEGFLWEMLAEAARETSRAVAQNPATARYIQDWGRDGDLGFVAEAADGASLGAAWLRQLRGENRGYGYVDDETPELAIAVRPGTRGAGIGARLLAQLLEAAKPAYHSISLSVRVDNPAINLYEKVGFRAVEDSQRTNRTGGTSITMKLDLHE